MPIHPLQFVRLACLRQIVIWALVVALPAHSVSMVLLQVMGSAHRHSVQAGAVTEVQPPPWSLRGSLRALTVRLAGEGALAVLDAGHAREQARMHATSFKAPPLGAAPLFTEADIRRVSTQPDLEPQDIEPAIDTHSVTEAELAHQHAHDTLQRHNHDANDGSVIVLGDKATSADAPGTAPAIDAGGGTFPLPALFAAMVAAPVVSVEAWRQLVPHLWHSHVNAPLERPPQR